MQVDPTPQTTLRHIYACGDVNGKTPLFHAAVRQSLAATNNIMAGDHRADVVDFLSTPTTVFTLPAAAYVGLTRTSAVAQGVSIQEGAYSFAEDSRAQIFGETGDDRPDRARCVSWPGRWGPRRLRRPAPDERRGHLPSRPQPLLASALLASSPPTMVAVSTPGTVPPTAATVPAAFAAAPVPPSAAAQRPT
ncbi:hypothetical protein M5I08_09635 [Candidatus Mycobacterium methanotrophicum]|uniref:Pyridine nucleotide-disulphide oxidoreductase dimerisation domain-containing protein n=2 Tax=Candidatus Mycobacterium methanotrophicum TaxID=2943498 RepID=A0ABY4QTI5_9MYCO|nr:hypothetical protein [Candidatus Mycobacterium methanotrophicum]UQX13386.1 hypothetical protein M5I08_09635 [Candidatus Mycobacterium methanotrophicum]